MIAIPSVHPALIPVSTPEAAAEFLLTNARAGDFAVTLNWEMIARALENPAFRERIAAAPFRICDGIGGKWLLSWGHRGEKIPRIAGIDLGMAILRRAAEERIPVFFLGGREGVAERAAERLCAELPALMVAGCYHGYFPSRDLPALRGMIRRSGAQIVIVCLGSPRQEAFAAEQGSYLPSVKLFLPLGGSLDVWSGSVPRAPLPMRRAGLEWLWRISLSPARVARIVTAAVEILQAISAEFEPKCVRIEKRM